MGGSGPPGPPSPSGSASECTGNSNRKLQLDVSVYYVRCAQSPRAVCHSFTIARRLLFPDFRILYLNIVVVRTIACID
jgi:hypothetical protein